MFNRFLLALFILFIVALLGWCSPQCSRQSGTVTIDNGNKIGGPATLSKGAGTTVNLVHGAADNVVNTAGEIGEKRAETGAMPSGAVGNAGEAAATAAESVRESLKSGEDSLVEEPAPRPEDFAMHARSGSAAKTIEDADKREATPATTEPSVIVDEKLGAVLSRADDSNGVGSVVLEGVTFQTNADALTDESMTVLDTVVTDLKRNEGIVVEIAGYTDNTGDAAYNLNLSQRRAQAVVDYLSNAGVSTDRLIAKGYGGAAPVADNTTAAGRAKNRRVELHVVK